MPGSICDGSTGTLWRVRKPEGVESTLFVLSLSQLKTATLSLSRFLSFFLSLCILLPVLCIRRANTLLLLPEVFPHRLIAHARPWDPCNAAAAQRDTFDHLCLKRTWSNFHHITDEPGSFNGRHDLGFSPSLISSSCLQMLLLPMAALK